MKIQKLDDNVINHIAAGEVVERPVSVLRELVDNALDAGATQIRVDLEAAGKELLRVEDNGVGIPTEEIELAIQRHATSKIQVAEDLEEIDTRGFRGEALSSIASVSEVHLTSRPADQKLATQLHIRGGEILKVDSVPSQVGTVIEVAHLFFNTPARKKFLKTDRTEIDKIKSWMTHIALGTPQVRFELFSGGKEILFYQAAHSQHERAQEIFDGAYQDFFHEYGDMSVSGRLGHPSIALGHARHFVVLVNNRVVSDRGILRAVREGFDSTLKPQEYPVGFLSLTVPPAEVDVNVHPQKSEVRFRDQRKIFQLVRNAVLDGVRSLRSPHAAHQMQPLAPQNRSMLGRPTPNDIEWNAGQSGTSSFHKSASSTSGAQASLGIYGEEVARVSPETTSEHFLYSELRYIGQALECYLFCEKDNQLYVIDMHAAHERYNFNHVRNNFHGKTPHSQQLLVPLSISLSEDGVARCLSRREMFESFGFALEAFGEDTLLVRGVPTVLVGKDVSGLIKEVAELDYEELSEGPFHHMIDEISARIACHASIRSGKKMEREEVHALLADLDKTEFSAACPHGRPIIVSFSETEIEKWFGRDR